MSSRGACEGCHMRKEKCDFDRFDQACSSCRRLVKPCRARRNKRMGRLPVAKSFPHGNSAIFSLGPETPESSNRSQNDHCPSEPALRLDDKALLSSQSGPFAAGIRETVQTQGKPLTGKTSITRLSDPIFCSLVSPHGSHNHIYGLLKNREAFYRTHRHFMLGRSFINQYQNSILVLFYHSPELLSGVYHAILDLARYRETQPNGTDGLDLTAAADCLQYLRHTSASLSRVEDAAVTLVLGQTLLVHHNMIIPCSSSGLAIARSALLSAEYWFPTLISNPEMDPVTVALVLVDTLYSLICREMPIIRLPDLDRPIVDRFAGVCSSLLPILYDLCESSYRNRGNSYFQRSGGNRPIPEDPYDAIEQRIKEWAVDFPANLRAVYAPLDVEIILKQARLYRLAALLIVHRLRFPLGVEDDRAHGYARMILNDMLEENWAAEGVTGSAVDFPLLVAMVELPGLGETVYQRFERLRIVQRSQENLGFVRLIRNAYDAGYRGLWLDLVKHTPQRPILP